SAPTGATVRRGQAKSSARPAGAAIASPFTSTLVATASVTAGRALPPANSSDSPEMSETNGMAGPASGLALDGPALPGAAAGAISGAVGAAFGSSPGTPPLTAP